MRFSIYTYEAQLLSLLAPASGVEEEEEEEEKEEAGGAAGAAGGELEEASITKTAKAREQATKARERALSVMAPSPSPTIIGITAVRHHTRVA